MDEIVVVQEAVDMVVADTKQVKVDLDMAAKDGKVDMVVIKADRADMAVAVVEAMKVEVKLRTE